MDASSESLYLNDYVKLIDELSTVFHGSACLEPSKAGQVLGILDQKLLGLAETNLAFAKQMMIKLLQENGNTIFGADLRDESYITAIPELFRMALSLGNEPISEQQEQGRENLAKILAEVLNEQMDDVRNTNNLVKLGIDKPNTPNKLRDFFTNLLVICGRLESPRHLAAALNALKARETERLGLNYSLAIDTGETGGLLGADFKLTRPLGALRKEVEYALSHNLGHAIAANSVDEK